MSNPLRLKLSNKARSVLEQLSEPLVVELELYFSCLIRKRVLFSGQAHDDGIPLDQVHPNLKLIFRPVMTKACLVGDIDQAPDVERFPIEKPMAFMPHWLSLDFVKGQWRGEFGYGA